MYRASLGTRGETRRAAAEAEHAVIGRVRRWERKVGPAPLAPHVTIPMWVRGERTAAPLSPGKPATPPAPKAATAPATKLHASQAEPMVEVEKTDGPAPMTDVKPVAETEEPEITPQENGSHATVPLGGTAETADIEMQDDKDGEGAETMADDQIEQEGQAGEVVETEQPEQLDIVPGVENDSIALPTSGSVPDPLPLSRVDLAQSHGLTPTAALPLEDGEMHDTVEDPPDIAAIAPDLDGTAHGAVVDSVVGDETGDTTMLDDGEVEE